MKLNRDFTFLHPEVFDEKCNVVDGAIKLTNRVNFEKYRVIVLPGMQTICYRCLNKIRRFYENGGCVIATTRLPVKSSERGADPAVKKAVAAIFGIDPNALVKDKEKVKINENAHGGKACFLPEPAADSLKKALAAMIAVPDVRMEYERPPLCGNVSYIHKVKEGNDIYFFANSSETAFSARITLRGVKEPEIWDPHNGKTQALLLSSGGGKNGESFTSFRLELPARYSLFAVCKK